MYVLTISALALSAISFAAAAPTVNQKAVHTAQVTALLAFAPKASTCDGAPAAGECKTADQAAAPIMNAFRQYKITTAGEMAAVLSLMAFESGDFKYNTNHFPGRPGQGTRNMQMPPINLKYAQSISALAGPLQQAGTDPVKVLNLLRSNDNYDFGSASWYLTTQCTPDIRSGLRSGSEVGWSAYITSCVQTTPTDDRKAYWVKAKQALGMK